MKNILRRLQTLTEQLCVALDIPTDSNQADVIFNILKTFFKV